MIASQNESYKYCISVLVYLFVRGFIVQCIIVNLDDVVNQDELPRYKPAEGLTFVNRMSIHSIHQCQSLCW